MSAPGPLYAVRHGRTAGNGVRYVGQGDEPLDDIGRAQAQELADRLAGEPIAVVYASPLSRALDTARPFADRLGAEIRVRPGLMEIDYGAYQDVLKAERKLKLKRNHRTEPMPGGESLRDVHDRVAGVLAEVVADLRAGLGVAVVAHYWSLRMLVGGLAGMSFEEVLERGDYAPENASVWRVEVAADGVDAVRVARASWA